MAMDSSKFEAIKNKARKMIAEDAKKDAHIIKARQADRNNPAFFRDQPSDAYSQVTSFNGSTSQPITESYYDDNDDALNNAMDSKMKAFMESRNQQPQYSMQSPTQMNKNLPKEILESFSNNYIDQSVFDPNRSVLDKMGITGDNLKQVTENYQPQQQTQSTGKVDYEIIKNIVEGAVKKYVNALGKKMLTENNELGMIQIGEKKLNLVAKNGDIYEATLVKKGNIKNIKSKS